MSLSARVALVGVLAFVMMGCGRREPSPSPTSKAPLRRVVLQTDWFPQAEHGGFYQALAKGYYAEAGLDADIWPGGPGSGIKLKVAKGEADFGMNRSDDLILAASQGLPLVMVAATLQHDPMALMVHESSPVRTFKDLDGRVIIGNVGLAYLQFLERRFQIKFERRQNTYGLGEFLANPATIQQCIVTSEPFFARQHGKAVRTLSLAEAGYDSYHTIFCRRELLTNAPAVVRTFVAASIRGWRDYLDNDPAPAHAEILRRNPQMTAELLAFSRAEMIRLRLVRGDPAKGEDVGRLSVPRVAAEIELLRELGVLEAPIAAKQVATDEFLSK